MVIVDWMIKYQEVHSIKKVLFKFSNFQFKNNQIENKSEKYLNSI